MSFFDDEEDAAGAAEVFRGLIRPKLVLGMNQWMLAAAIVFGIMGAVAASVGLYSLVFFILSGLTALLGVVLGFVSPYLFEEVGEYLSLRAHAGLELGGFVLCDDAGEDAPGINGWRS